MMEVKEYSIINVRVVVSLICLLLIGVLGTTSILTMRRSEEIIIEQKKDLLLLLSKNIVYKITHSFIIPSMHSFGVISLTIPEQYSMLSSIIENGTNEFSITECNIFSSSRLIYTSVLELKEPPYEALQEVTKTSAPVFNIIFPSVFDMILGRDVRATLQSFYPINIDITSAALIPPHAIGQEDMWGILELSLDCTTDIEALQKSYYQFILILIVLMGCAFFGILTIVQATHRSAQYKVLALEKMKKELSDKERLASMGRLVASLAHEIRNPLGIIYSSIQLCLKTKDEKSQRLSMLLVKMNEEITYLRTLVDTFLDYAKPPIFDIKHVNIASLTTMVCMNVEEKSVSKGIAIHVDIPEDITVLFNKDALYRALLNLVENALDAPEVTELIIYWKKEGDAFSLCIDDNGKGFVEKEEIYVEPFYTTKDDGVGLGLAIVKNTMEAYGGKLSLSNHTSGARACLILPKERVIERYTR